MSNKSATLDSAEPHAVWPLLRIAALVLGLVAGWRYTPAAIMDIPIVQVLAILAPAALGVFLADLVRVVWLTWRGPQSAAERLEVTSVELVLVIFALVFLAPLARVYNWVQTFREQ